MTREELRSKCEKLASVGDAQAKATLELFEDFQRLTSFATKAQREIEMEQIKKEVDGFRGVTFHGQAMEGVEPKPKANVPPPRRSGDSAIRENKPGQEPTTQQAQTIAAIAKEFGIYQDSPEVAAAAATRIANGLPPTTDPGATAVTTYIKTAGYEKVPGATKDGNKE